MRSTCGALLVLGATTLAAACREVPATDPSEVEAARASWLARGITSYRYDFSEMGFFVPCGSPVRVYVHASQRDSVIDLKTGQPDPYPQICGPTITELFDRAVQAAQHGQLGGIRYGPGGYPAEIDLPGPPDASGSLYASNLEPLR